MKFIALSLIAFSSIFIVDKAPPFNEEFSEPPPRIIRTCCSFGTDLKVARLPFLRQSDITSRDAIGVHQYLGHKDEGNGNIYTRKGGFIDLAHLRDCADWTAYLYNVILSNKSTGEAILIDLGTEGGNKTLKIDLPPNFDYGTAHELAGKIAYDLSLWHEIATWFGASYIPMIPERYSSFSPEDLYSNLLGVTLGMKALKSNLKYDEAMSQLIASTLDTLDAVHSMEETVAAMEQVEGIWWSREKSLPNKKVILKRYFDLPEEQLNPWLLPTEDGNYQPLILTKPSAHYNQFYKLEIKLNYKFPLKDLFLSPSDKTISQEDFGLLMSYIQQSKQL